MWLELAPKIQDFKVYKYHNIALFDFKSRKA